MTIRKLTLKDHGPVFRFFSRSVRRDFPEYTPDIQRIILYRKRYWTSANYKKRLTNPDRLLLGAFDGPSLVGLLDTEKPFAGVSLAIWLMVEPDYRKQGVARRLVAAWEESAGKTGGHCLYLFSPPWNKPVYEKLGFTQSGTFERGWFGCTDIIFQKIIAEPDVTRMK